MASPEARRPADNRDSSSFLRSLEVWGRLTGGALAATAALLSVLLVLNLFYFQPRTHAFVEGAAVLRRSHEAMLDQQVGLRGYLQTGERRYLEAYDRGRRAIGPVNVEAARLIGARDRMLAQQFLDLRVAQQRWLDGWAAEALELGGSSGGDVPEAFVAEDKELFDAYRATYDRLIAALVEQRRDVVAAQRTAYVAAIATAIGVTVAAGVFGARRSRRLRRSIEGPLGDLLDRIGEIGRGELDPRPLGEGPGELHRISQGIEETAARLRATQHEAETHAAQLDARGRRQGEVLTFAREAAGTFSLRYVLRGVCRHASAVADDSRVVVWLLAEDRNLLEAVGDSTGPDLRPIGLEETAVGEGLVGLAARYGRIQRDDAEGRMAIPMVVGAQVIGVLEFVDPFTGSLPADAIALLETMAIHAASAIDGARLHEKTSTMAMTDVLTGLANRRRLDEDLAIECANSARYQRPLTFLMIDVDHFKSYNDSFGHQAGDVALQSVGHILAAGLRAGDRAYRYGGEEFALLLRETAEPGGVATAERLRAAVEHHFAAPDQLREVTISIGVADLVGRPPTPEELVTAADQALYDAKRDGRNRVVVAGVHQRVAGDGASTGTVR